MQSNVIRFIALDFIVRLVLARMMDVSFIIYVFRVDLDDPSTDSSCLRVPCNVIANTKLFCHCFVFVSTKFLSVRKSL
jgi:hypothetical protein